ncbi:MAG: lysoplasmalogenase [Candidatus Marinimicrobia bacterium]|nr:lysoplasmalogenase [Candidatus Neomarinimicrobiota bacterium]
MFKVILYIILVIVAIITNYRFRNSVYKFAKTLPVLMLILLVGGSYLYNPNTYSLTILIGLIFCLGGDILLLFPDYFKTGLFSFLTGHFWYIGAFTIGTLVFSWPTTLFIALTAVLMITQLWESSEKLRIPVLIYILVISTMVVTAWSHFYSVLTPLSQVAALGATLFMISDSILAWNRFKTPFKSAEGIILLTYYTGQYLIAHSAFF